MPENILGFHYNCLYNVETGPPENGLTRGELFNFPAGELAPLTKILMGQNMVKSIHTPLVKLEWYPDPPTWSFLCDIEEASRNRTFRMIAASIEHATEIGAEYIVVHFPTLSTDSKGESESQLLDIARKSCDRLAELSVKSGIPLHVEGLVNSPYLSDGFLIEVLSQYPLRYCFDTGHMSLASKMRDFDLFEFVEIISPYVGSVHLWNSRGPDDYQLFRHIPVHPSQNPEDGWADIEKILKILKPDYPVIFESPPMYPLELGSYDYLDGVKWVKEILSTSS